MAHSKQAKKRVRTNDKARIRNKVKRSAMRTHIKRLLTAIENGDRAVATTELHVTHQKIDKAAKDRVIHPNNAARKKSRLTLMVNAMAS